MRLLLVDREFPPNPHGGIGAYNYTLANTLGQLGHFVLVLSYSTDKVTIVSNENYGKLIRIPYIPITNILSKLKWLDQLRFSWMISSICINLVKQYDIDLVEFPSSGGYGAIPASKLVYDLPVITRFHGSLGLLPIDKDVKRSLKIESQKYKSHLGLNFIFSVLNQPQRGLEISLIKNSRYISVPSEFSRLWLNKHLNIKLPMSSVIPNFVDVEKIIPYRSPNPIEDNFRNKVFSFIGRCGIPKGTTVLARAVPHILAKEPSATIIFAGSSNDSNTNKILIRLIRKFPDNVKTLGHLPHKKVLSLLSKSTVLVHPTFYETSSMIAMEAMALGVPVIASNIGPLPEIIKHQQTGLLFNPGDEIALTKSVLEATKSADKYLQMRESSISSVKASFDSKVVIPKLLHFYMDVLNE